MNGIESNNSYLSSYSYDLNSSEDKMKYDKISSAFKRAIDCIISNLKFFDDFIGTDFAKREQVSEIKAQVVKLFISDISGKQFESIFKAIQHKVKDDDSCFQSSVMGNYYLRIDNDGNSFRLEWEYNRGLGQYEMSKDSRGFINETFGSNY
ncbi:hypothetical protein [uncultured Shewanella sp.]|uniref:hypothetical protein n=1 Tax=uncultured Shewanella sp. TaxID=173975 RepID=UPI0026219B43|nr:hypothetical protein [uncultured Shewanella sp.]